MTTKKLDDLTIEELNEQVALCQGWQQGTSICDGVVWLNNDGYWVDNYDPCHNAQQSFEIIEREKITIAFWRKNNLWRADISPQDCFPICIADGKTSLIAAMRCFVKSVKGETVEV